MTQPHQPTDELRKLARTLSAVGITYEDIASKIEISSDTLVKYYKKELSDGRIDANATVAKGLFEQAKSGNTAAAMFWLKTRAGWKETNVQELHGNLELKTIRREIIDPTNDSNS